MTEIVRLERLEALQNPARLLDLARRVFTSLEPEYLSWRIEHMPDLSLFVAVDGDDWLGFKCGYAMTQRRYYSWLGGVDPDHRGRGLAAELMLAQHDWLKTTHYPVVETHVRQDNLPMVRANQKFGFKIRGRFLKGDQVNLIMQREL